MIRRSKDQRPTTELGDSLTREFNRKLKSEPNHAGQTAQEHTAASAAGAQHLTTTRRPTPADYGVTEDEIGALKRQQERLPKLLATIGAVTGVAIGVGIADTRADAFTNAWLGFLAGTFFGAATENPIRRIIRKTRTFKRFARFDAAVKAFDRGAKEAQERELRKRGDFWKSLSGYEFENALAALWEQSGFVVQRTPGSRDGGVDLIIRRAGRTTVVQCKQTERPVGPAVARDLYGTLLHCQRDETIRADDAILAVTGGVTSGVTEFFAGKPLRIMELAEILSLQEDLNRRF